MRVTSSSVSLAQLCLSLFLKCSQLPSISSQVIAVSMRSVQARRSPPRPWLGAMSTARCGLSSTTTRSFQDECWRCSGGLRLSIQKDAVPGVANFLPSAWLRSTKLPHRNIGPGVDYLESFSIFSGHRAGTMTKILSRHAHRAPHFLSLGLALASLALL